VSRVPCDVEQDTKAFGGRVWNTNLIFGYLL
jgi:hypothetical protein